MESSDVPINPDVPVKKKRGRKPKSYYENLSKEEIVEQPKTEVVHKKRGRKPKQVSMTETPIDDNKTEEPIILHLPIKLNQSKDIYIPKPFIDLGSDTASINCFIFIDRGETVC